jgi:formylglycine-generating enzyme required for sulfatase activity
MGAGSTMLGNDGMTLRYVPAGKFIMGSNMDGNDEKPSHPVELSAFWIDQTEITNEMYKKCVEAGSCEQPKPTTYYVDSSYAKNPVVFVTWQDAVDYCAYVGRRLPTESEWEKAARGDDERKYPWGNQAASKDLLNYSQTNIGHTTPVNSYPNGASPYGAVDMAGNVIEWVNDLYSTTYYKNSPAMDPKGVNSGNLHVVRGGSFKSDLEEVTTYRRASENPANSLGTMGFRCARDE